MTVKNFTLLDGSQTNDTLSHDELIARLRYHEEVGSEIQTLNASLLKRVEELEGALKNLVADLDSEEGLEDSDWPEMDAARAALSNHSPAGEGAKP